MVVVKLGHALATLTIHSLRKRFSILETTTVSTSKAKGIFCKADDGGMGAPPVIGLIEPEACVIFEDPELV